MPNLMKSYKLLQILSTIPGMLPVLMEFHSHNLDTVVHGSWAVQDYGDPWNNGSMVPLGPNLVKSYKMLSSPKIYVFCSIVPSGC